jgi:hypothetical protein
LQAHTGDRGFEEQDPNTIRWRIADGQTYGDSVRGSGLHGTAASGHQDTTDKCECERGFSTHGWTSSFGLWFGEAGRWGL